MHRYMDDILALVLIVGCLILLLAHIDGEVKSILALAAGWLFGKGYVSIRQKGGKSG